MVCKRNRPATRSIVCAMPCRCAVPWVAGSRITLASVRVAFHDRVHPGLLDRSRGAIGCEELDQAPARIGLRRPGHDRRREYLNELQLVRDSPYEFDSRYSHQLTDGLDDDR